MERHLRILQKALIKWYVFCREICKSKIENEKIGGPGLNVELDETHIYTPKYHRGRIYRHQLWWFDGICRETNEIFVVSVTSRSKRELHRLIIQYEHPLSFIHTYSWVGYNGVEEYYNAISIATPKNFQRPSMEFIH